jgi:hypothetical protein
MIYICVSDGERRGGELWSRWQHCSPRSRVHVRVVHLCRREGGVDPPYIDPLQGTKVGPMDTCNGGVGCTLLKFMLHVACSVGLEQSANCRCSLLYDANLRTGTGEPQTPNSQAAPSLHGVTRD